MKKFILPILFLIVIGIYGYNYREHIPFFNKEVGGNIITNVYQCHTATTSPDYLTTSTATTSCTVSDIIDAKKLDLRFAILASTSNAIVHYDYEVTNDDAGSTRNFFMVNSSSGQITTSNSASTTYVSVPITNISAKYIKVNYTVSGNNVGVYLEVARQNELN